MDLKSSFLAVKMTIWIFAFCRKYTSDILNFKVKEEYQVVNN